MKEKMKAERIELQRIALLLELYEDNARTVPFPVLNSLVNLTRSINIKVTGKPV